MKKIPTIFERDWNGDKSRVVNTPHADCAWVFAGEGVATAKLDGTSCMVRAGKLYKRRELRDGDAVPNVFELETFDEETKKRVGWMPVSGGPEDRWHNDAFARSPGLPDGTYELLGPKVQGNPEGYQTHALVRHGGIVLDAPRTFDGLKEWLSGRDIEGIVWHHPDGRMAKIKGRDFGLKRQKR